jgi:hypothetical protein
MMFVVGLPILRQVAVYPKLVQIELPPEVPGGASVQPASSAATGDVKRNASSRRTRFLLIAEWSCVCFMKRRENSRAAL